MKSAAMYLAMTGATVIGNSISHFGDIVAVNAATAFAASMAEDISGYLSSMPSTDESAVLDLIAPPVQTADFFQFPKADDQYYLTEADDSDIRGLGANFKRIQHSGTIVTDSTIQKGLTKRIEHRTLPRINGKIIAGWEQREAAGLKNRLIRAEKVRALSVLDAASNSTAVNWTSTPATANPDGDIRKANERSRIASGLPGNILLIGASAQQARQDSYEAPARTNDMANHAAYTMEQLARYAGAEIALVENGIKQAKKGAVKSATLGNVAYCYTALKNPTIDDPSNIKRAWSPTLSGGMWMVFVQESAAWTDITVFHQSKVFIPIAAGVEKLAIS